MEVCPVGFFCFDKNTLMLIIVSLVLVVVFCISKNNDKFNDIKSKLDENKNNLEKVTTILVKKQCKDWEHY